MRETSSKNGDSAASEPPLYGSRVHPSYLYGAVVTSDPPKDSRVRTPLREVFFRNEFYRGIDSSVPYYREVMVQLFRVLKTSNTWEDVIRKVPDALRCLAEEYLTGEEIDELTVYFQRRILRYAALQNVCKNTETNYAPAISSALRQNIEEHNAHAIVRREQGKLIRRTGVFAPQTPEPIVQDLPA